jgi:G protein-coupled receptor Mth (Methuselah protein)
LSYTAQVYQQTEGYRNVHCAICNGILPENLICTPFSLARNFQGTFNPTAFSFLFDLNPGTGNEVGRIKKCSKEEVFDPFFQRCRSVLCAPGQSYQDGKCITISVSTSRPVNPNLPSDTNDLGDGTDLNALNSNVLESTSPKGSSSVKPSQPLNVFEVCPKVILNRDEYQILENGTVFVELYGKALSKKEYAVQSQDRLVICAVQTKYYTEKFGPVWGYVSFTGVLISVIFLILHLIACALVPDLRNLSGKNLASLCVALLLTYSIFLGLPFVTIPSHSCTVMAVILYYG